MTLAIDDALSVPIFHPKVDSSGSHHGGSGERVGGAVRPQPRGWQSRAGPGEWHRDREHGRCPRDQLSEYIGSDEHTSSKILKERFVV